MAPDEIDSTGSTNEVEVINLAGTRTAPA